MYVMNHDTDVLMCIVVNHEWMIIMSLTRQFDLHTITQYPLSLFSSATRRIQFSQAIVNLIITNKYKSVMNIYTCETVSNLVLSARLDYAAVKLHGHVNRALFCDTV